MSDTGTLIQTSPLKSEADYNAPDGSEIACYQL